MKIGKKNRGGNKRKGIEKKKKCRPTIERLLSRGKWEGRDRITAGKKWRKIEAFRGGGGGGGKN